MSAAFYRDNLVKTLDKRLTVQTLREWREETTNSYEADVLTDFIHLIEEGELDG